MMSLLPEVVAQDNNRCGEGPIWDAERRRLIWTDIESALVYQSFPANGEKSVLSRGLSVAGIALDRSGALVFAGATGLHVWRSPQDCRTLADQFEGEPLAFNDLIAGPQGRVYAGTVYWGADGMEKPGKLYLFGRTSRARVVEEGILLANGLGFSPDDRTLYFTDSAARTLYAYDVEPATGDLSNRSTFVRVPAEEGIPDGLTVDSEGFVWSAQWYGAQIVRYDPDGQVERRIPMPVTQVSSVGFGGDDLMDLYITTAGESWPSPLAPKGYDFNATNSGGSLYRVRLDVPGKPEHLADLGGA
jgi:sugar lactone lactonase YvrE